MKHELPIADRLLHLVVVKLCSPTADAAFRNFPNMASTLVVDTLTAARSPWASFSSTSGSTSFSSASAVHCAAPLLSTS
jgi:hypothetical protein